MLYSIATWGAIQQIMSHEAVKAPLMYLAASGAYHAVACVEAILTGDEDKYRISLFAGPQLDRAAILSVLSRTSTLVKGLPEK